MLLGDSAVQVVSARQAKAHLVVKFDAVRDRTAAEALRGAVLAVSEEQIDPPPAGSYYYYQIIGMEVWTEDGAPLGEVSEIISTGSNDVYVVRGPQGSETLAPALADVLLEVDPDRRRMVVRLPDLF